ncbi:MAG: DNA/RNA non-specific endonuclease [Bacteroidales bacterium]|nr:DNA/RNA non-specific endonuclease [Bacteroidales bacterium]
MTRPLGHILEILIAAALLGGAAAVSLSCSGSEGLSSSKVSISMPLKTVSWKKDSQFISVEAEGSWTLSLEFTPQTDEAWARLDKTEGSGAATCVLYWEAASKQERSVTVTLSSGRHSSSATLVQKGTESGGGPYSEIAPKWMELPATDDPDLCFVTHDMPYGVGRFRNYSFYLDPQARVSVWVAYPLNKALKGSGSRTFDDGEAWTGTIDPKVPRDDQAVVTRPFSGYGARGHQCPSADRLSSEANFQTFYGTNITPQNYDLNGGAWSELEGNVRNWMVDFDTLYVVTGADIHGYTRTAKDNDGKSIAVPVGYYKALLGYKRNASGTKFPGQSQGYVAIAFYFKNQNYSGDNFMTDPSCKMSVKSLEAKLGYDFFVNLPAKIGEENAAKVESTVSTYWK